MKKILIFISLLLTTIYLGSAIDINLSGGDNLSNVDWNNVSNITNKISLSSNNLDISGKLISSSKICAGSSCLGECDEGYIWDNNIASCVIPATTFETAGITCKDIKQKNSLATSGIYYIDPDGKYTGNDPFKVYCDMDYDGGGRTRYVNIKGNYSLSNAVSCWQNSSGKTLYSTALPECFNPNRYGMAGEKLMLKELGNTYTVALNGKVETNVSKSCGFYCTGHSQYMTSCQNNTAMRFGLSYCHPVKGAVREVGGIWSGIGGYMSYSRTGFGPSDAGKDRYPTAVSAEFYIK